MTRRKMEKEEIKKRVAAGIENRRKKGLLRPITAPITTVREGPALNKEQKTLVVGHITIATAALAQHDRDDYLGGAVGIWTIMRDAGIDKDVIQEVLRGIAGEAAMLTGDPYDVMDAIARGWLSSYFQQSKSIIAH